MSKIFMIVNMCFWIGAKNNRISTCFEGEWWPRTWPRPAPHIRTQTASSLSAASKETVTFEWSRASNSKPRRKQKVSKSAKSALTFRAQAKAIGEIVFLLPLSFFLLTRWLRIRLTTQVLSGSRVGPIHTRREAGRTSSPAASESTYLTACVAKCTAGEDGRSRTLCSCSFRERESG